MTPTASERKQTCPLFVVMRLRVGKASCLSRSLSLSPQPQPHSHRAPHMTRALGFHGFGELRPRPRLSAPLSRSPSLSLPLSGSGVCGPRPWTCPLRVKGLQGHASGKRALRACSGSKGSKGAHPLAPKRARPGPSRSAHPGNSPQKQIFQNSKFFSPEGAPATRWSTTLSSKVNQHLTINFRARWGVNLVT